AGADPGSIGIDGKGGRALRPRVAADIGAAVAVGILDLEQPVGGLAGATATVADRALVPVRLLHGDRAEQILVETPLAGRPADDRVGRAGVVAADAATLRDPVPPVHLVGTRWPLQRPARNGVVGGVVVRARLEAAVRDQSCAESVAAR